MILKKVWQAVEASNKLSRITFAILLCVACTIRICIINNFDGIMVIDESIYISAARSLFNSGNVFFQGQPSVLSEILYPIVLSPVYNFYAPESIMTVIRIYGMIVFSLGYIPIYMLARKLLRSNGMALIAVAITLIMPDMFYGGFVSQEVVHFPLMMLTFYVFYRTNESDENKFNYPFLGILLFLLTQSKSLGLVMICAYLVYLVLYELCWIQRGKKIKSSMLKVLYVTIPFVMCKFLWSSLTNAVITDLPGRLSSDLDLNVIMNRVINDFGTVILGELHYVFYIIIAFAFFPVIISTLGFLTYDNTAKKLFIFTSACTICTAAVIVILIYIPEGGAIYPQRVHMRYLFYMFVPYLLLMLKLKKTKVEVKWWLLFPLVTFVLYFLANVDRLQVRDGSRYDNLSLQFFSSIIDKKITIMAILLFSFFALAILLVKRKLVMSNKFVTFCCVFIAVTFACQNVFWLKFVYPEFGLEEQDFSEVAKIASSDGDTLMINSASSGGTDDFNYNRLDGYLKHDEQTVSYRELIEHADSSGVVDLKPIIPSWWYYRKSIFPLGKIDDVVVYAETQSDYHLKNAIRNDEERSDLFDIYQIEDSKLQFDYTVQFSNGKTEVVEGDSITFFGDKSLKGDSAAVCLTISVPPESAVNHVEFTDGIGTKNVVDISVVPTNVEIKAYKLAEHNAFELTVVPKSGMDDSNDSFCISEIDPL